MNFTVDIFAPPMLRKIGQITVTGEKTSYCKGHAFTMKSSATHKREKYYEK